MRRVLVSYSVKPDRVAGIGDLCDKPPATEELSEVGSYGFFEDSR